MKRIKGFTLLEVLVVVVIATSVLLFAVPAYKRMQDKMAYTAAQGVLISIGSAVRSFRVDLGECPTARIFPPTSGAHLQVVPGWQDSSASDYTTAAESDLCDTTSAHMTNARLPYALFAQKFLEPIPFTKGTDGTPTNEYGKYKFYVCPQNQASAKVCCDKSRSDVVACMWDTSTCSRATKGQYYGARFLQDGSVVRFERTDCTSTGEEEEGTEFGRL